MKNIVKSIMKFFINFLNVIPGSIVVLESHYPSGSNTRIISKKISKNYKVDVMCTNDLMLKDHKIGSILIYIKNIVKVSKYNIVISSNGFNKYNNKQTLIELWHGIPLKAMMNMENDESVYRKEGFNANYLITSSKLESSLMSACTHIPYSRHKILGAARNDYFFKKQRKLSSLDFIKNYAKVIFYIPTYRQGYLKRKEGNPTNELFYLKQFNNDKFSNFLKENNILLIVKFHPFEESQKRKNRKTSLKDNVYYLTNDKLRENRLDLYELLPYSDLLITDYSSVYFDYLLLDKPIIFVPSDLSKYSSCRGLVLEPYNLWTPGPKCVDQDKLQKEIIKSFKDKNYYKKDREKIKKIFHKHKDGASSERIISLITEILKPTK